MRAALVERSTGELIRGLPKSRAGLRAVTLPRPVVELLMIHLAEHVDADLESLIFTGDEGAVLRRSNFNRMAKWPERVAALGAPGLHFHDLRHTGNLLAAASGASLRDLMSRTGHDSMRAALICTPRRRPTARSPMPSNDSSTSTVGARIARTTTTRTTVPRA